MMKIKGVRLWDSVIVLPGTLTFRWRRWRCKSSLPVLATGELHSGITWDCVDLRVCELHSFTVRTVKLSPPVCSFYSQCTGRSVWIFSCWCCAAGSEAYGQLSVVLFVQWTQPSGNKALSSSRTEELMRVCSHRNNQLKCLVQSRSSGDKPCPFWTFFRFF